MIKYKFFDTDVTGKAEYDICGEEYRNLIRVCCQYSSVFSFLVNSTKCSWVRDLDKFRISADDRLPFAYGHYFQNLQEGLSSIRFYHVCMELEQVLIERCHSIFSWTSAWGNANPDDPTFYRADGSIFFSAIVHEGECTLTPKEDERIDEIIKNQHWILTE